MERIRLGIVGASAETGWAKQSHIPALRALPEYEFIAACTSRPESAERAAEVYRTRYAFSDYRDLVRCPEVDAVTIAVRVPWHREIAIAALREGKHVYCEWPLAPTVAEAEEMAEAAHRSGLKHQVGLQGKFAPWVQYVKELVQVGTLGRIFTVNARLSLRHSYMRPGMEWAAKRASGNHILWIQVPHILILIVEALGDLVEVSAQVRTQFSRWRLPDSERLIEADAPDNVAIHGQLANGAALSAHFAYVPAVSTGWRLEVYGEKGTLVASSPTVGHVVPNRLEGSFEGATELSELEVPERFRWVPPGVPPTGALNIAQAYRRFSQAVLSDGPSEPTFDTGLRFLRILTAIEQSSRDGGRRVRLN